MKPNFIEVIEGFKPFKLLIFMGINIYLSILYEVICKGKKIFFTFVVNKFDWTYKINIYNFIYFICLFLRVVAVRNFCSFCTLIAVIYCVYNIIYIVDYQLV